jgi:EREBP-like factor
MRRDFEAVDRSEAAEAMAKAVAKAVAQAFAETTEWERIRAEANEGRVKYRGVRKVSSGKYTADTRVAGKQKWLGTYATPLLAACAYDIGVRSLRGHKARPNFAYPPPPDLVAAIAARPRRRGHSSPALPAPPAQAPAPAPFVGRFSSQAPGAAGQPAGFLAYQFAHVPRPARARLVQPAPVAPVTATTAMRSIPPGPFSFQESAAYWNRINNPVKTLAQPMHMVAPPSSVKTCFSSTADPMLRDSASSSSSPRGMMFKKPKVIAVPTTTSPTLGTNQDCEFTDDNFTALPLPSDTATCCSEPGMPFDINKAV